MTKKRSTKDFGVLPRNATADQRRQFLRDNIAIAAAAERGAAGRKEAAAKRRKKAGTSTKKGK